MVEHYLYWRQRLLQFRETCAAARESLETLSGRLRDGAATIPSYEWLFVFERIQLPKNLNMKKYDILCHCSADISTELAHGVKQHNPIATLQKQTSTQWIHSKCNNLHSISSGFLEWTQKFLVYFFLIYNLLYTLILLNIYVTI